MITPCSMHKHSTSHEINQEKKLPNKISVDNVIAVMREHFPGRTMTAEEVAREVVRKFRDKAMRKAQAFDFARDKLRGKLSDKISADNVIATMGEHFPVSTMTADQEARKIVRKYREAFLNVENLFPSSFLDVEGVDVTGIMYHDPRPENVCHLGVDACIPMRKLS